MSQEKEQKEQVTEEVVEETAEQTTEEVETVEAEAEATEIAEVNEVEELEKKLQDEENRYLRLRADFDNFKRRTQTERESAAKYRSQSLLTDLLPVLDNFERALQVEATTEDGQSIKKGIEMVYRSLVEATAKEGLEVIETVDHPFDPNVHQAVMQEQDDSKEAGVVLQELQRGYKLKDRVLRPAMVKVNE
ncbi:nucleotide exchange factor GrpE [Kurthia gibsonii]|uniref:Protein GrpE n=1 Tax=Kurthia gibsonii TaxID=33946 RepID=A0ABU9LLK8_9BACL|nr:MULTISPECIES: nucleotide exchange factor GrpE [Kurthia]MCA9724777.1 nucleotide exchange factor GrpE [Kurthia sp.]AMA62918.1 protein grpE [Kurthia sp. 11kri321]MEB6112810.1 nucleotide exchange factor GrpE [Kurthia gibsonii]MEB7771398.1 nucleotide exchange factor GrpE [Kurthia gibsonii]RXH51247.1 nucleotide exchange factor GrpE [Kurthia gibsonii]